jgi:hypothetical protein
MSTLWLLLSPLACFLLSDEEREGVNFYVRNRTGQEVDVSSVLEDRARREPLATGHVHLAAGDTFGLDGWDGPVVPFVVRATVRSAGETTPLQGEWPGDAGFGDGGRVGIQVIVDDQGAAFDPSI